MPRLKRTRQSFTFEYKLKVIARADERLSQKSQAFACQLKILLFILNLQLICFVSVAVIFMPSSKNCN